MNELGEIRYQLIKPMLARYNRRFSVLDLGAGINPYLAQRISNEFDCVYTLIEQNEIAPEELEKLGPRAMWLRKTMNAEDLERLACCEHFDVVLAFNILHHFGSEWPRVITAIDNMCDQMIVQTPYTTDLGTCATEITPEIHDELLQCGTLLGETVQFDKHCPRPVFLVECGYRNKLTMSSWTSPPGCIDARIASRWDYKEIELLHKPFPPRPYIHGLNLWNFAQLNGQWPRKDAVLKLIREFQLPAEHHGDVVPHNFLLDGADLYLIDGHEGWEFDDHENLLKTERMMEEVLQ